MDVQQPYAAAPVVFTADGRPYYATAPQTAPLALYQPAAHLPAAAHPAPLAQPYTPQPLPAVPARDPWPARLLCGGIGIGAAGVGIGFLLQQIAAATTGLGCLAAVLALLWLLKNGQSGGGRGAVNVNVTTHNRNR